MVILNCSFLSLLGQFSAGLRIKFVIQLFQFQLILLKK